MSESAQMSYYAVIAAIRIQAWLTRTPRLRLMRGGSTMLGQATTAARARVKAGDLPGVVLEAAAGEADGVVAMRGADQDAVAAALREVLRGVRQDVPGVQWDSWLTSARSYPAAFEAAELRDAKVIRAIDLPAQLEFPAGQRCSGCHAEVATTRRADADDLDDDREEPYLGVDCSKRWDSGRASRIDHPPRDAHDFAELAEKGGWVSDEIEKKLGRRGLRSHLATICADGNNVGRLFKQLKDAPEEIVTIVSRGLGDVTRGAVETATGKATASADVRAAIVHFVGGDDVFVSVPAVLAWDWARNFDETFRHHTEALAAELAAAGAADETVVLARQISASVGIAFADSSHPVADSHRLAEHALRDAKTAARGEYASVSWLDQTVESSPVPDRVLPLSALHDLSARPEISGVAAMNPTARATLSRLLDASTDIDVLRRWASRVGKDEIGAFLADPVDADWHLVLQTATSLARWWPHTNREASE